MSMFNTFSSGDKIFNYFIRNSRTLNFILMLLVASFVGLFAWMVTILALFILLIIIIYFVFYEVYMRKVKSNGTIEITESNLKLTTENSYSEIENEEIVKIIIIKECCWSAIYQNFRFVLLDIIWANDSMSHLIVKKFSNNKRGFDIIKSLRIFSEINSIKFEMKE